MSSDFIQRRRYALAVLLVLLGHASHLPAQSPWGMIEGTVRDADSAQGIEGVQISHADKHNLTAISLSTNASGSFSILGIPPDCYDLVFQKGGYPDYIVRSICVESGYTSIVNLALRRMHAVGEAPVVSLWQNLPANCRTTDWGSTFSHGRISRLPSPRDIWAILENQDTGSVTNRSDEGGIATGTIALVGAGGRSWTSNGYRFDGIDVTDPFNPGKPLVYPAFGDIQEFQAVSGLQQAQARVPGADFRFASRSGGDRFHGQLEGYYSGEPFQSSNVDDRLRAFGYDTTEHFRSFPEVGFSSGGPVPHFMRTSFYASLGYQHVSKVIPDFAAIPETSVFTGLIRVDKSMGTRDQLALTLDGAIVTNSQLRARSGISPSSTLHGNDRFEVIQAHWIHRRDSGSIWDVHFGFSHSSPTDTLQPGVNEVNRTQQFTGEMTGAAPLESDSALSRFSVIGQGQSLHNIWGNRLQNRLDYGFDLEESITTEELRVYQGLQMLFYPKDVPSEIIKYNSPSHTKQRLREFILFFDDRVQVAGRIFLHLGLNMDASNTSLPQQQSGAGEYVGARDFAGAGSVISWTSLSPRAGIEVPISERFGNPRIGIGFSRYYHVLPASYANFANPTGLGGSIFRWDDKNHDGLFQPGEEAGLLRVFGDPYSSVDPHLERPYTDEWSLSFQQNPCHRCAIGARFFHRNESRLIDLVNTGAPRSAYTPVTITDPGDDGIPGTGDDKSLVVYDQRSQTLGQDRYLLTNPVGFKAVSEGMEFSGRWGFLERAFAEISFMAFKSVGDGSPGNSEFENDTGVIGGLFTDPNASLNSRGRLFFDRAYTGKIAAYWPGPFGLEFGSVVKYFDGLPFGRRLVVAGLNQGPFFVMATPRGEPGGFRTQFNLTFDQRIARDFRLGRYRLSCVVDIFNLPNLNRSLREYDLTGPLFPLRIPLEVQNPRVFRIGIRLNF